MKSFLIFITCSISFVTCEAVFGQRLSASNHSTHKESNKTDKDLDTHESFRTYEFALPPIEVQSRYPKVIAEEHTIHELAPLKPALPYDEPIHFKDSPPAIGPIPEYLYSPQHMPKHYGQDLPIYRDDPKELLKGYLPIHPHHEPSTPVHYEPSAPIHHELSEPVHEPSEPVHQPPEPVYHEPSSPLSQVKLVNSLPPLQAHHIQQDIGHLDYIPGIPGIPWKDYPLFNSIPYTNFKCGLTKFPGYYADIEAGCQVWHFCQLDGRHDRFLCANGTLFNQKTRVCDWWYNVDCQSSLLKYDVNRDLYHVPHNNYNNYNNHVSSPKSLNHQSLQLPQYRIPLDYHRENDPYSGSLIFAETKSVPQKIIKRIRKVRVNTTNSGSELLNKNSD